jgi:hypothetical protein
MQRDIVRRYERDDGTTIRQESDTEKNNVLSPQRTDLIRLSFHPSINLDIGSYHACISVERPWE